MNIPDPSQELDRKVLEELERLELKRMKLDITPEQYNRGVATMWNVAAGLIPKETMDLLGMAPKDTDLLEYRDKRVFYHPHKPQTVRVERYGATVYQEVAAFKEGQWLGNCRDFRFDAGTEAAAKFDAIIKSVVKQGFEEL